MVSLRSPLGAGTDTVSPFLRPISALPTGDSFESRLLAGSASVEPTIAYSKALPFSSLPAHERADAHDVVVELGGVDDLRRAELVLELRDALLEHRLLVLGVVVLGVLRDVAELARFLDALRDLTTAGDGEVLDLLLELLESLGGEDDVLLHASSLGSRVLEYARPAGGGPNGGAW